MSLIAYAFPKLHTVRQVIRENCTKVCFRTPVDNQHIQGSQRDPKFAKQCFYHFSYQSEGN